MTRLPYFIGLLGSVLVIAAIAMFIKITWLGVVLAMCAEYLFAVQRLKNIGWQSQIALLSFVPVIGVILGLVLLVLPSEYAAHKRLDKKSFLAIALIVAINLIYFWLKSSN